jgi:S-adenosylmethionine:tRNA ribosyltransferase-isomerase
VRVSEFDYLLPAELIAQRPLTERDASRMLLMDRASGSLKDSRFVEMADALRGHELLVFNNAELGFMRSRLRMHRRENT